LLFYNWKSEWLTTIINATATRLEGTAPEIMLDPLETIGQKTQTGQLVKAAAQLDVVDSSQLRVRIASGGDPLFPLTIRLSGETVQGNSGSFREFLLRMSRDMLSPTLPLLMECPSAAHGRNRGRYILNPHAPDAVVTKLFEFVGKLIGMSLRSDIPLPVDLLPAVWKALLLLPLDDPDIHAADSAWFHSYTVLKAISSQEAFEAAEPDLQIVARSLTHAGHEDVDISSITLVDLPTYLEEQRAKRLADLSAARQIHAIRTGLGGVIPLDALNVLSPSVSNCWVLLRLLE
jgi:E3 ubiquitin-protein ligase HECTD4